MATGKQQVRAILESGIQAGEIRPEADLDAFGVCIYGVAETLFKAARFHGYDRKLFLDQADRALGVLLAGVGTARS